MKEPDSVVRTIEEAAADHNRRRPRNKKHSVIFSADGKIEIPLYKLGDGTHCFSWYAADGSRCRKTAKDPTLALTLAKETCRDLWQSNGFGSRGDCHVLISEPTAVARVRSRNLLEPRARTLEVKFEKFIPQQIGWRNLVRQVISSDLTAAQKVVLLYASDRGFESGRFYASTATTEKDTGIHQRHVKRIYPALVTIGWFKAIGRKARGVMEYALQWPSTGDLRSPDEEITGELKSPEPVTLGPKSGDLKSPKADKTNRSDSIGTNKRLPAAGLPAFNRKTERHLLMEIQAICGKQELEKHGGMWRKIMRDGKDEVRALHHGIEDWKMRTPDQRHAINKPAAWLMDRYKRCLEKIRASNEKFSGTPRTS